MVNPKQEKLAQEIFDYAKAKFPEIKLVDITLSSDNPYQIGLNVSGIDFNDDDRYMDFYEHVSVKVEDILVDYGYKIQVNTISTGGQFAVKES